MSLLEDSWEQREEKIYPSMLGSTGEGIYPLDASIFQNQFNVEEIDPRWFHYGVFKCPPTDTRDSWVYVTSGMSNAWEAEEPEEYSGFGTEFILETESESNWAIHALRSLVAFNILIAVGKYGDKPLIDYGDRIPLRIEPNISNLMIVEPKGFPNSFKLMSGKVDVLQVTGITSDELEFAQEHGSTALAEKVYSFIGSYKVKPNRSGAI